MAISEEFRHLVHRFHQDMLLFASTEEGLVANAVRGLTPAQKRVIKGFLTGLLAEHATPEPLQAAWEEAGPDWSVDDESIRILLTMIRDAIEVA